MALPWEEIASNKLMIELGYLPGYVPDRRERLRNDLREAYDKRAKLNQAIAEAERALSSLDSEHDQPM